MQYKKNEMIGFTKKELETLMKNQEITEEKQKELLHIKEMLSMLYY